MENFNQLTPAEHERLSLLLEELGEAQQAIGKILRHGYESHHPELPDKTNRSDLEKELGHIENALAMLCNAGDISSFAIMKGRDEKRLSIGRYLHHQEANQSINRTG